jgi:hypothetical protein
MVIPAGHIKKANMGLMLLPDPRPSHFCSIRVEFSPHRSRLASDLPDANRNIYPKGCVTNPVISSTASIWGCSIVRSFFFVPSPARIHEG